MKAPKIDSAKVQQLLLMHVEKIVLGVVLLAVLWFVYQGATLPGLETAKTPDLLTNESATVTTEINNPGHWAILKPQREPNHDVQGLVKQGQEPNDSVHYKFLNPLKMPDYPKASLRVDPRIFSPEKIKATPLFGPVAYLPKMGDTDPILSVEVTPPAETVRPGGVRQPNQPPRQPQGEGRQRPRPGGARPGAGMLEGGAGFQEGMAPPGYGQGMAGGTPGSRTLPPEAMVGVRTSGEVMLREARAVVVMAVVPLEKQIEEYEKAFKDALDYDPYRDVPRFVRYRVERIDVTDNPAQDPATAPWAELNVGAALTEMNTWASPPREVVDLNSIDPILTHPVPPFLQREVYEALVHPEIPKAKVLAADPTGGNQPTRPGDPAAAAPPIDDDDLTNPTGAGPAAVPGQPIGEGAQRPGPGGVRPGGMMQPGGMRPGMMQPGGIRGGYGEGLGGVPGGSPEMTIAKYKLLRFTDSTVQPLRKYRYRVKVVIEDPNNPYVGDAPPRWDAGRTAPLRKPSIQSMSPNVLTRVRTADTTFAANPRKAPFLLESEPSEPSDIVELPLPNRYFAGKATPGAGSALKPGSPLILNTQPSATLLTVAWDKDKAVDVPAEKEVFRGSTLNFDKDVDVIHPAQLIIHPIGKYSFRNNTIVVDFSGGDEIPSLENRRSDTKVQKPSEILVFDGMGSLQLLDETDDIEGFRRYLPPKVEVPKPATGTTINPEGQDPGGGLLGGPGPPRPNRGGGR